MDKIAPSSFPFAVTVVIVAAGRGTRFGADCPKQYQKIQGRTILRHTIEKFVAHPAINHIQVVIEDTFRDLYNHAVEGLPRILPPVIGGSTRQESVFNAISALKLSDNDVVLIHDAARPCFSSSSIDDILDAMITCPAASLAIPASDTLRKTEGEFFSSLIPREGVFAMQTPQAFRFGLIKEAHYQFKGQNFTDDTALVSELGAQVKIITGEKQNIKITVQEDLILAEKFLAVPTIPVSGLGFDVHAFGDMAEYIRIGGVDIPHTHKLKGHSDADVLLHAITDALYGAIAEGDIGSHFPPSNPAYKGKDSRFFLEHAVQSVKAKGGKIVHIDSVIMCEAPKIGPHREAIQNCVADIVGLPVSRVSVKATTTEELGFTGRREGIAAQAIVTILLPDIN